MEGEALGFEENYISTVGGFDFDFKDELSPGYKCSICHLAMRDAVQTNCGHRFCESCLLETFRFVLGTFVFLWSQKRGYNNR